MTMIDGRGTTRPAAPPDGGAVLTEGAQGNEATTTREGAAAELGRRLDILFTDRRYTMSYLARQCRTSMAVVKSWASGRAVPIREEWRLLCGVSRSFLDMGSLWEAALAESAAWPPVAIPATIAGPGAAQDETPVVVSPTPASGSGSATPILPSLTTIVSGGDRELMHGGSGALWTTLISSGDGKTRHGGSGADRLTPPVTPPGPAITASPPPRTQAVMVPADFVLYACKLSRGRFVQIPLPLELTRVDVERIHAFLLTQVDDPEQP